MDSIMTHTAGDYFLVTNFVLWVRERNYPSPNPCKYFVPLDEFAVPCIWHLLFTNAADLVLGKSLLCKNLRRFPWVLHHIRIIDLEMGDTGGVPQVLQSIHTLWTRVLPLDYLLVPNVQTYSSITRKNA